MPFDNSEPARSGKSARHSDEALFEFTGTDTTETLARCNALRTRTLKSASEHREVNPFPAHAFDAYVDGEGDDDGGDEIAESYSGYEHRPKGSGQEKERWRRLNDAALAAADVTAITIVAAQDAYAMPVRADRISPRGGKQPMSPHDTDKAMVAYVASREIDLIAFGAGLDGAPRWLTADVLALASVHDVSADKLAGRRPKGRWPLPSKNTVRSHLKDARARVRQGKSIARQDDRQSVADVCGWRDAAEAALDEGTPWLAGIDRLRGQQAEAEYQRRRNEAKAEGEAIRALDTPGPTTRRRVWLDRLARENGEPYDTEERPMMSGPTLAAAATRLSRQWEGAYRKVCDWDNGRYREGTRARADNRKKLPKELPWINFG